MFQSLILFSSFSLPPSEDGEWWELSDESRGGIPYYYQTKTGETVWERPDGFVIPLTVIQVTRTLRPRSRYVLIERISKRHSVVVSPRLACAERLLPVVKARRPTVMPVAGLEHKPTVLTRMPVMSHLDRVTQIFKRDLRIRRHVVPPVGSP